MLAHVRFHLTPHVAGAGPTRSVRGASEGFLMTTTDAARSVTGSGDKGGLAPPAITGYVWGVLRLVIGWTFLWAFVDKMFGLGFATCRDAKGGSAIDYACSASFMKGGSPTFGFLTFATPASHTGGLFDWLAPSAPDATNVTDWIFMLALLGAGVLLMLGVMVRISGIGAALLLIFMYLASAVWPENNPFVDDHIINAIALVGVVLAGGGRWLGFGRQWERLGIVQKHAWLK